MNKKQARELCFEKLNNLSNKKERDKKISEVISTALQFSTKHKYVGLYMPIRNECVLELQGNFTLCYPKVFGKEMKFFDDSMGFEVSSFGIEEPLSTKEIIPNIIIAPCVGYFEKYRLGYGGGYYDRYLAKYNIPTIGIAYSETKLESLEVNDYDIELKEIIVF